MVKVLTKDDTEEDARDGHQQKEILPEPPLDLPELAAAGYRRRVTHFGENKF